MAARVLRRQQRDEGGLDSRRPSGGGRRPFGPKVSPGGAFRNRTDPKTAVHLRRILQIPPRGRNPLPPLPREALQAAVVYDRTQGDARHEKNTDQSRDIRTYALDRVTEMEADNERFEFPADMPPADFFKNIIGITASKAEVRTVKIITTPTQAKYFRALPFHATQEESIHDNYSVFTFRLKLNYELVHELLGFGNAIKVVEPRELVVMLREQLENTLSLYDDPDSIPKPQ